MNWFSLYMWLYAAVTKSYPILKSLLDMGKQGLDMTKTAQDIFNPANQQLKEDTADTPADRAYAAAALIRSIAIMGFLEYLLWATKIVGFMVFCNMTMKFVDRLQKSKQHVI